MKKWYAASIIILVKFKDGNQDKYPVWENIKLIKASLVEQALKKAERMGCEDEGDDDGTFRWGKRKAEWVFAGIRKLISVSELNPLQKKPGDGTEVTYSQFILENEESFF
jgi:hypothetical protein